MLGKLRVLLGRTARINDDELAVLPLEEKGDGYAVLTIRGKFHRALYRIERICV
jgi:hypothetical protein